MRSKYCKASFPSIRSDRTVELDEPVHIAKLTEISMAKERRFQHLTRPAIVENKMLLLIVIIRFLRDCV